MLRSVGSNWALTLTTIAASYVLTPFVIRRLGPDGYGTWTLIVAMTGYMSLMALGVPMACVRFLAQYIAERDTRGMNATIGSCAGLYLAIGMVAIICGGALTVVFSIYDIPSAWRGQARAAMGVMVLQVAAGFIGLLPEGIMFAHHDFVVRNLVRIGGVILRLVLTVGLLTLDSSLVLLALVQLLCLAFDFLLSMLLIRRRYANIRVRLGDFDWTTVRRIFSFSLYVFLLAVGARLSFETDALVIGAFLSVGAIPFYAVANSLVVYLMDFVTAIAAVVSPMATTLHAERRAAELEAMFLKWSKVALSISVLAGVFLIVLGPAFIGWWIDPSFEQSSGTVLQVLMISSFVFLPARGVALPVLLGVGKPRTPTIAFVAAGLLNLVLSVLLVRPLGLTGVAIGTAVPNVLFALVTMTAACREVGISVPTYLRYVVLRAALGSLPLLALLAWFKFGLQVNGIAGLAAAGFATLLLFCVTWVLFVYRDDPFVDMRPYLVRLRAVSAAALSMHALTTRTRGWGSVRR
jgi:O-antigen/teichoic acid export membrane protein